MISGASNNKVLTSDADGNASWQTPSGGSGTVTSVGLSAPSIFSVSGSPVTTSGTLSFGVVNQNANLVWAGPTSGGAGAPSFRALVANDISAALAAPPAIGGTTPAAATFTTISGTSITGSTSIGATLNDSGTNTIVDIGLLTHNSTGTPTTGFGTGLLFSAESSTTTGRSQGRIRTQWTTATDASRKAKLTLSAFDTAEREGFAIEASGSAAKIGFFGVTPFARVTGGAQTAGNTYTATEKSMLQTVYDAMRNYGLLT
jgi:hypothetical protein